jgi:hypothetical protein
VQVAYNTVRMFLDFHNVLSKKGNRFCEVVTKRYVISLQHFGFDDGEIPVHYVD